MKYIIEHLEAKLYRWCEIEYEHISTIAGKENLIFTNIKTEAQRRKLKKYGEVYKESVAVLNFPLMCVLDPFAKKELVHADSKEFDYCVFGGILGDHPMQARTKKELVSRMKNPVTRHIGKEQFPTDNAVYVVREILEHHKKLNELKFVDEIDIELREGESIQFPFRYVLIEGKPLVSENLVKYLKKRKMI
jgi:ribosome biogenesis SPOUT family RNA methylase Rps3